MKGLYRTTWLLLLLALGGIGLVSACQRADRQEPEAVLRARELVHLEQQWQALQKALEARDMRALSGLFHPVVVEDYRRAPELMMHLWHNAQLAELVRGEIRAAIIDPPLALVSTATDTLRDSPTDWVWYQVGGNWKLVGNREAVHLENLIAGRRPLLRDVGGE